jgi:hypothetical protein
MLGRMDAGDHTAHWRVNPALPVVKLAGAAALTALGLVLGGRDPVQWAVIVVAATGLVLWAARDVVAPVRLAADPSGVTVVTGFARRRRLAWSQIERVRVDHRARLGVRTELLEIDTGEALYLLGRYDLDAPPGEAADALTALRTGAR